MKKIVLEKYKVIFLDDGGVMNDNEKRTPQWRELVAQYFSPRYGGSIQDWKKANKQVFELLWERYERTLKENPMVDYVDYWKREQIRWLTDMFKFIEIPAPPYDQCAEIAREASVWITSHVRSAYPGVNEAVNLLKKHDIKLCTASGEVSWELRGYLTGMGVLDSFHKLYGPDIINRMKANESFYQKILDDMQIDPSEAIVVDDSSDYLAMASKLGITTIHVDNLSNCTEKSCQYKKKTILYKKIIIKKKLLFF